MSRKDLVDALIETQGRLYSEQIGADIFRETPQELFHWLIGSILLSARISSGNAVKGAAALREAGLHKIDALLDADRREVVRVLNRNGYARYDESTADYLRETAAIFRDRFSGDLRKARSNGSTLKRLQCAKGLGPVGARIFAREAQAVWDELFPELGGPAEKAAAELGLPTEAGDLSDLCCGRERYVRLVAALTRVQLEGPSEKVQEAAGVRA
ncbi:hypothetical protein [Histidinibacterium lentulum]|uniref:Endonuclease n=1 Tax=Histidinibacterium lentulum TaxID=2480588 RepID=A0A3N2RA72_9RHOB|nr:hypothetical protein [Histidinibacterium lentulum]ROU04307.1 hypothetical protein EAT49_02645 [Histidinibacterium lentulum]